VTPAWLARVAGPRQAEAGWSCWSVRSGRCVAMVSPSPKESLQSVVVRTKPFRCRLGAEGRNQTLGALKAKRNTRGAVDGPVPREREKHRKAKTALILIVVVHLRRPFTPKPPWRRTIGSHPGSPGGVDRQQLERRRCAAAGSLTRGGKEAAPGLAGTRGPAPP
jgi:hypothetical protein